MKAKENMKRKIAILAVLTLLVLCIVVGFSILNSPTASPTSPAVGTWKGGALSFVLKGDGKGQQLLGSKHTFPLEWTERNGFVTIIVHDPSTPAMEQAGQLSADERTLTITQSYGKAFPLRLVKSKVNWALKKQ
jgi:hypothetical protein